MLSNHVTLRQLQNHPEPCFSHVDEYFGHSKHLKVRNRQKDDWMVLSGQLVLDFSSIRLLYNATGVEVNLQILSYREVNHFCPVEQCTRSRG